MGILQFSPCFCLLSTTLPTQPTSRPFRLRIIFLQMGSSLYHLDISCALFPELKPDFVFSSRYDEPLGQFYRCFPSPSSFSLSLPLTYIARDSSICLRSVSCLLVGSRNNIVFDRWQSEITNSKFFSQSKNDVLSLKDIIEAIMPLFQGKMLYLLSVIVKEYLDL